MQTVWKTELSLIEDDQIIMVPAGSRYLHVAEQHGKVCLWYQCDDAAPLIRRGIAIRGTGKSVPGKISRGTIAHIGTVLLFGGDLVLHIFDTDLSTSAPEYIDRVP